MHGEVRIAANDDRLDLAHEQAFATDLCQRAVLDAIALGPNVDFFDLEPGEARFQLRADPSGLNQGEVAAPRCDP